MCMENLTSRYSFTEKQAREDRQLWMLVGILGGLTGCLCAGGVLMALTQSF